jgi:beta-lactamase class A
MLSRRNFILAGSVVIARVATPASALFAGSRRRFAGIPESLAKLEKDCDGRLGVALVDTASGEQTGYRADERFAMCSTFKKLLAAAVLHRVDAGIENLNQTVALPTHFLPISPVTQAHAGSKMSIHDLCTAAVSRSDNTAANLLLALIGGPSRITRFARSLGDQVTRLDRIEMTLNEALPGDPRDTTSPAAMVADWRKLLLGNRLLPSSRRQLRDWLIENQTGGDRLRADLAQDWVVGDKTGTNGENTTNDVAILWPPDQSPVLIAAYLTACPETDAKRNAVLAEVGRLIAKSLEPA